MSAKQISSEAMFENTKLIEWLYANMPKTIDLSKCQIHNVQPVFNLSGEIDGVHFIQKIPSMKMQLYLTWWFFEGTEPSLMMMTVLP